MQLTCCIFVCTILVLSVFAFSAPVIAENETAHIHPDEAGDDGDIRDVADHISELLSDYLGSSSEDLSAAHFEAARTHLGDDYDDILARYNEIADETGREEDPNATDHYDSIQADQERFIDLLEEHEELLTAYEAAVARNDQAAAQAIAQELREITDEIVLLGERLDESYELLNTVTAVDVTTTQELLRSQATWAEQSTDDIVDEEFTAVTLEVTTDSTATSYTDPVTIHGSVDTEEGDPVDGGIIHAALDGDSTETTVEAGTFSLTLQPLTA